MQFKNNWLKSTLLDLTLHSFLPSRAASRSPQKRLTICSACSAYYIYNIFSISIMTFLVLSTIKFSAKNNIQKDFLFILLLCILSLAFGAEEHTYDLSKRSPATPKDKYVPLYRRSGKGKKSQPPPPSGPPPAKRQKKSKPPPPTGPHPSVVAAAQRITQDPLGPLQMIQGNLINFASEDGAKNGRAEGRGPGEPPLGRAPLAGPTRRVPGTDEELAADELELLGDDQHRVEIQTITDSMMSPEAQQWELDHDQYNNPNNIRYDSAHRHEQAPQDTTDLTGTDINYSA
jgi:hypothetical protein